MTGRNPGAVRTTTASPGTVVVVVAIEVTILVEVGAVITVEAVVVVEIVNVFC